VFDEVNVGVAWQSAPVKVIARIREIDQPADPNEFDEVEAEASGYEEARELARAKVPDGWQIIAWMTPDRPTDT